MKLKISPAIHNDIAAVTVNNSHALLKEIPGNKTDAVRGNVFEGSILGGVAVFVCTVPEPFHLTFHVGNTRSVHGSAQKNSNLLLVQKAGLDLFKM